MAEIDDVVINIDGAEPIPKPVVPSATVAAISESVEANSEDLKSVIFKKLGVMNSSNPWVCIAHIFFKVGAAFMYLFSGWIVNSVMIFILVSIFSVLDFWVVKNVSGRILVSLRWWTTLDEKGNDTWLFESFDYQVKHNPVDSSFFWYGQIANSIFWTLILTLKVLTLSPFWVILALISAGLSSMNLYAFYKCKKDYQNKLTAALGSSTIRNAIFSTFKEKLGF